MDKFKEWCENRHEYAREWKRKTNWKVVGCFCTYVPEEILLAANILPVRMLGGHEQQSVTEPHIFGMYCPFCRDVLAQGLQQRFDYLDGIVLSQSCMHLRQAFDSWKIHVPVDFSYYIHTPVKVQSPRATGYYANELRDFKKAVEQWVGKDITDKDLDRGIEIMNENRRLMREVYELRKKASPPLTGVEAMQMTLAAQMVDKQEHNEELRKVIPTLVERDVGKEFDVRLMLVGSEDDDIPFIKTVEDLGTVVVIDEHCTGSRYFWNDVVPDEDRLSAIADRYISRIPCPSKDWEGRARLHHALTLAEEWDVQGAVLLQQKFCDPHEFDMPVLKEMLEDKGVKCYELELDAVNPLGPIKIRMEAFVEMFTSDDLFA